MKNILKKVGVCLTTIKDWLYAMAVSVMVFMMSSPVYASNIGSSKIATGTEKLVEDLTTWLLIIAPAVTIVAIGYYFIRKAISDELDHKKWNTRVTTAIISCVGVMTASIIVKVVLQYYK